jgi:hypothetical protein
MHLKYGVSQGSVLDPRLYCLFSKPIGEICRQHDMDYHCYAADTQEYLVIEPLDKWTYIKSHRSVSAILSVLSKNSPRFLTHETSLTTVPSKERRQSENNQLGDYGNVMLYDLG